MLTYFKYLGRVLLVADYEWLMVVQNVVKVRTVWWRMSKILRWEVVRPRIYGFFFKSIILSVVLFDADYLVVTPHIGQDLSGLQDHMARRLTGGLSCQSLNKRW